MSERKSQQELDFERKHEEDLQRLRGLRLIDDDFMAAVFEERACAEFLLQIILKRDDLTVKEVHGQYSIKNLQGRSVRLDILAVDRENRAYNIEVQRSDRGASEKRARYNSSLLDANLTDAGNDYDALNETYVIFITENDVLKAGLPIYHVDRTVRETGTVFNDQAHIVYVNSQIKDETALGKLMHDFFCTNSKDMNYSILAQRVRYFKEDTKGVAAMCRAMEKMRENRAYNIEVQRSDRGASEKRARYNSSLLDANLTDAGNDYDALNETYVIFITENDVLKAGLPIYHVDRTVRETGTVFNDQAHIVYVNSQIKDETALGKLMHDFFCTNSKDMNYSILAQRVRYFKEDTKGVAAMCRAMEKMRDETEHETSVKHALAMLADGVPCEKVAKYTDLSIEEVRALAEKKSA